MRNYSQTLRIASVVKAWRIQQGLSIREAAQFIGLKTHSALWRLERGHFEALSAQTLARILSWLMEPIGMEIMDQLDERSKSAVKRRKISRAVA